MSLKNINQNNLNFKQLRICFEYISDFRSSAFIGQFINKFIITIRLHF